MVSLLDEIESQVKDRKLKKDKAMLIQTAQNAAVNNARVAELSNSNVAVPNEHRVGGIASSSVPHIRPVNTIAAVPAPLTPVSNQTGLNPGFTFINNHAPKSQMVIVPKDKLNPAGPNKVLTNTGQNNLTSVQVAPPKNTPVSTTKLPTDSQPSKPLYVGAYTKVGGFQQRSSSNDGPTKADSSHPQTNPLVSPRKPQTDTYGYASAGPTSDKPLKPLTKATGGLANPTISGVNPARDFGVAIKKGESSVASGMNKSSGTAISGGSKKPLNLFGLKFLSKGPGPTSGDRR